MTTEQRQKPTKPIGRKAYGSIGHLPDSRLGPADHCITKGQARIATEKARDKHDRIIVQEKLDGSCVAVALQDGKLHPLGRSGYPASSSPYMQHHLFHDWAMQHAKRFRRVLQDGERIVGEWLAQAHGTRYRLSDQFDPFAAFDIIRGNDRLVYDEFLARIGCRFSLPCLLSDGDPISVKRAMELHREFSHPCDEPEGVVYRVERMGKVDFLCKWVRPDKIDGKYLPELNGEQTLWNLWPDRN